MTDKNNSEEKRGEIRDPEEEEGLELENNEPHEIEEPDLQEELTSEEVEFDVEAQIELFRQQVQEEPDNCIHHYNITTNLK